MTARNGRFMKLSLLLLYSQVSYDLDRYLFLMSERDFVAFMAWLFHKHTLICLFFKKWKGLLYSTCVYIIIVLLIVITLLKLKLAVLLSKNTEWIMISKIEVPKFKVRKHTKLRRDWYQHKNICKDKASGGVNDFYGILTEFGYLRSKHPRNIVFKMAVFASK